MPNGKKKLFFSTDTSLSGEEVLLYYRTRFRIEFCLLSFLTKRLNNGFITLNVQVYTEPENGEEKRRLFTAKDKFDHFVEINPAVSELKALFGLEIE